MSTKRKKDPPKISPENQISQERIDELIQAHKENPDDSKAVIELSDTKEVLYIASQYMRFMTESLDLMASIIYDKEAKTIEMRGRIRYETTGNKTIFSDKKPTAYTQKALSKMKAKINAFIENLPIVIEPIGDRIELQFAIGSDIDTFIQKLNDSGRFNIGMQKVKK